MTAFAAEIKKTNYCHDWFLRTPSLDEIPVMVFFYKIILQIL
jgi:hypothetical protein